MGLETYCQYFVKGGILILAFWLTIYSRNKKIKYGISPGKYKKTSIHY
ncbi:hypothetical protein [Bacillus sp. EAC]|nr:hypothetical protein [Bacillus sp. EAC]